MHTVSTCRSTMVIGPLATVAASLVLGLPLFACEQTPGGRDAASAPGGDAAASSDADPGNGPDASPLGIACAALGGSCVDGRWASCPDGTEPVADVHSDCKPATSTRGYFCCVPAESTACRTEHNGNCFAGECPSCWGPLGETHGCQPERTCCGYNCLD